MVDIRSIGVYKNYDKATEETRRAIKIEEESILADNYDVNIVNYENERHIYI